MQVFVKVEGFRAKPYKYANFQEKQDTIRFICKVHTNFMMTKDMKELKNPHNNIVHYLIPIDSKKSFDTMRRL